MVRAIRSTSAAAIVEEAVMAAATGVAVAIDAAALSEKQRLFRPPQGGFLDSF
jgi:CBS-domain-containing membrane protein